MFRDRVMKGRLAMSVGATALTCVLMASSAWAQTVSGITGIAKDTSGAVLPGVTVEAASPALIEKVRTAVTDGEGRYSIVDLRPGAYSVTFSLAGFNTLRREGIELGAGFTATVNGDMTVGSLEETLTVTGAAPLVDTQSVRQQNVVSKDMLSVLPTSQMSMATLANVTPGMIGNPDVGGTAGTYSQQAQVGGFHGKTNTNRINYDGMRVSNMCGVQSISYIINGAMVEEMVVETGGFTAESNSSSVLMNAIPKEGANSFRGDVYGMYTNEGLQGENLNDDLRSRGITTGFTIDYMYHFDATLGGPLKKDKLWFFTAQRWTGNKNQVGGIFWNKTQGTPFYTPDTSRPGTQQEDLRSNAVRLTWQISQKNKINAFVDVQDNKMPRNRRAGGFAAPEALTGWHFPPPAGLYQATWSSPVSNRLLLEAGVSFMLQPWCVSTQEETGNAISILEQSTNFTYGAAGGAGPYGDEPCRKTDRYAERFSVSYITGSHNYKFGVQHEYGIHDEVATHSGAPLTYRFNNGIPNQLTQYTTPYILKTRLKADMGIFAQDRWTINRLTLNYGLRFDYLNVAGLETDLPATQFAGPRKFDAIAKVPEWKDVSPRAGFSFDLFGDGSTAVKATVGKYVIGHNDAIAVAVHPITTTVNSTARSWTDANGNFSPDCNLTSPLANGECGPFANLTFGQQRVTTRYADDVTRGYGVRDYLWDLGAEVQRQLGPGLSVTGGYYRNWYNNFRVTDNQAVTSANYDPYCITAPVDARLPGGGGYQVCGLFDINPSKFGQVDNLVTQDSHYGDQKRYSDFFSLNFNWRAGPSGLRIGGGVDTGRTITDQCFTIDSPQQLLYCRQEQPFKGNTQVKLNGSYPLPFDMTISGILQSVSGPAIAADYPAPTAIIAPSLGRPLAGNTSTATVPLIKPFTQFEGRRNQLDVRLTKAFNLGPRYRLRANLDLYNALNSAAILGINPTFGPQWRRPQEGGGTNSAVLDARLIQVSGTLVF